MQHRTTKVTSIYQTRTNAENWLARFAPLLEASDLGPAERLRSVQQLRREGEPVLIELSAWATESDQILLTTLREALEHLKTVEEELALRVTPTGKINLIDLRAKLAEAAARSELGETVAVPARLELLLSGGNIAGALGMGGFALFWNAFTLVHATFMIGGFWKAFGPVALLLLAFYSLFFGVGFVMAKSALDTAAKEELILEGNTLVLRKSLGLWVREKQIVVGPQSRVGLSLPTMRQKGSRALALTLNDADGKVHQFGVATPEHLKSDFVKRLNASLAAL